MNHLLIAWLWAGQPIYVYNWHHNWWRVLNRKGRLCIVLKRGGMNSCLVQFADGYKAVISRNALRKMKSHE